MFSSVRMQPLRRAALQRDRDRQSPRMNRADALINVRWCVPQCGRYWQSTKPKTLLLFLLFLVEVVRR